jgi:hypothetical protein
MSTRDPMTVSLYPRPNRHVEPTPGADVLDLIGICAVVVLWIGIVILLFV